MRKIQKVPGNEAGEREDVRREKKERNDDEREN